MQVAGYRYDTKTDFYDNDRERMTGRLSSLCVYGWCRTENPHKNTAIRNFFITLQKL